MPLRMRLWSALFCFASLFFLRAVAVAAEAKTVTKVRFVTEYWEGFTNRDGTGLYLEVVKGAIPEMDFSIMPWKRAQTEFEGGKFDGIIGADDSLNCTYPKWPIDSNKLAAFYRRESIPKYTNVSALSGKKVVWVRGYGFDKYAQIKPAFEVDTMQAGINMVLSGRADLLIDYLPDIRKFLESQQYAKDKFASDYVEFSAGGLFVCFKGSRAKDLAGRFDAHMDKLQQTGELKKIYTRYTSENDYIEMLKHKKK